VGEKLKTFFYLQRENKKLTCRMFHKKKQENKRKKRGFLMSFLFFAKKNKGKKI